MKVLIQNIMTNLCLPGNTLILVTMLHTVNTQTFKIAGGIKITCFESIGFLPLKLRLHQQLAIQGP